MYRNSPGLFIIVCLTFLSLHPLVAQSGLELSSQKNRDFVVAFYNVENLFDTLNDPLKIDEDFLPEAKKNWNSEKYYDKLDKLASTISKIGGKTPAIVGLCEVENELVLKDLTSRIAFEKTKFGIVHAESPDERGIDVALLYDKSKCSPVVFQCIPVVLGADERPTRDILYARMRFKNYGELHVFVNHWPSRSGGAKQTESKRVTAALALRAKIDEIRAAEPEANILCIGDFNDYPHNVSLTEYLGADEQGSGSTLINLMSGLEKDKRGSYQYGGEWGFLDQIIVSPSLVNSKGLDVVKGTTGVYFKPEMIYTNSKGEEMPNRTYSGDNYYGGYSDHLPVYTRIWLQK